MKWTRPTILGIVLAALLSVPLCYLLWTPETDAGNPTSSAPPNGTETPSGGQAVSHSDVPEQPADAQTATSSTVGRPAEDTAKHHPMVVPPIEKITKNPGLVRNRQDVGPALLPAGGTANAAVRVGTVNMKTIFEGYWRTQEATTQLNGVHTRIKQELEARSEKSKALEAEIVKFNADLRKPQITPRETERISRIRQQKIDEWQAVSEELKTFTREQDKSLQDETQRLRNSSVAEIKAVVNSHAQSQGLDLVFETSGNSINNTPVAIIAKPAYDFTQAVITILNANRPNDGAREKPNELATTRPHAIRPSTR